MKRRFIQHPDTLELIEVDRDFATHTRASNNYVGDAHYDGLRATDGADISTRTKHREYQRRMGVTTIDDFSQKFYDAEKNRHEYRTGEKRGTHRAAIERAIHDLQQRGRR